MSYQLPRRQVSFELELQPPTSQKPPVDPTMIQHQDYPQDYYQQQHPYDRQQFHQSPQQYQQTQYYQQQSQQPQYQPYQQQHTYKPQQQQLYQQSHYPYAQYEQQQQQYQNEKEEEREEVEEYHDYRQQGFDPINEKEKKPLILHDSTCVQFPSKMPDPNRPPLPEPVHLGQEKNIFVKGTVLQFPKSIRDPNLKPLESSHLGEENQKLLLHQGSVVQFPKSIRDPNLKPLESSHLGEENQKLLLHQGSVVQFPKKYSDPAKRGFQLPEEVAKEELPPAEVDYPDHLLPSQARKQQAYNTHPHNYIKINPNINSNSNQKKETVWPPTRSSIRDLPKVGFNSGHINPESSKQFVWPPPKPEYHRSFQELPPPGMATGPAANSWNPMTNGNIPSSYRPFNITRRKPVWPPPSSRGMIKQSSLPETAKAKKLLEFDEFMKSHASINVPPTYRVPPGTQYYEIQYELEE